MSFACLTALAVPLSSELCRPHIASIPLLQRVTHHTTIRQHAVKKKKTQTRPKQKAKKKKKKKKQGKNETDDENLINILGI